MSNGMGFAFRQLDLDYCTLTGNKLDLIGQMYDYPHYHAIGVVRSTKADGSTSLIYMKLEDNKEVSEITNKQHIRELNIIWTEAVTARQMVLTGGMMQ